MTVLALQRRRGPQAYNDGGVVHFDGGFNEMQITRLMGAFDDHHVVIDFCAANVLYFDYR